ncbi:prepilin-type N-terminal cleavage/methylation domain-containing protein [Caminibacter mediatlanticus TB-2]|uniref:Prepilin-type N-terminal cleavage/methylation domain-containing protein n=1 Tax=Caminibacter mediatlanticus TB-2 TaxID=391592 RepID=A0ABX5V9L4_9BACT|nr:prepilin-type N-terminal cleavage/methylation domain-containing protein [Caminibacter mediatlanticus]QCT94891.1 prepilin-type N-terminal cleavage/methylation domain-containing protein [Caminibacter mediatlanticus TB-2]
MKRSFTLIEILIVIIILGILGTISSMIITKIYENYYYTKEYNKLSFETDLVLNKIAAKLKNRIKNSVIADECNISNNGCQVGNITKFNVLSAIPETEIKNYKVIEWLGEDLYAKRGIWDNTLKALVGYSGFVDLKKTIKISNIEYNITTPFSNFNYVKSIESNWTKQWGINGDIFDKNLSVLIFSGPTDRGDFLDVNSSYGWWKNKFPNNKATRVFKILSYNTVSNDTTLHIKAIDIPANAVNSPSVYEKYYIVNSAYAIVPECKDSTCNEYNLTLKFNYYPWNGEDYNSSETNSSLLATNVTQFKFRETNGVIRILICISSPKIIIKGEPLTVCKEKVVF